jgi:hypothetical protein
MLTTPPPTTTTPNKVESTTNYSTLPDKKPLYDLNFIITSVILPCLNNLFLSLELSSNISSVPALDLCAENVVTTTGDRKHKSYSGTFCISDVGDSICFTWQPIVVFHLLV